ncbi:helix-turn-helix transcriptional regulator [Dokdonia sp.]|uniref:helix-turn-helix domain-containing protein n=1 Tax=Dokdonia sp. TaxID=2024995 RepID=UPI00326397F3
MLAKEIINRLLEDSNKNSSQFADFIGVSTPTITRILNEETLKISRNLANKICDKFPDEDVFKLTNASEKNVNSVKELKVKVGVHEVSADEFMIAFAENFEEGVLLKEHKTFKLIVGNEIKQGIIDYLTDDRTKA